MIFLSKRWLLMEEYSHTVYNVRAYAFCMKHCVLIHDYLHTICDSFWLHPSNLTHRLQHLKAVRVTWNQSHSYIEREQSEAVSCEHSLKLHFFPLLLLLLLCFLFFFFADDEQVLSHRLQVHFNSAFSTKRNLHRMGSDAHLDWERSRNWKA